MGEEAAATLQQFVESVPWEGIDPNGLQEVMLIFQTNGVTVRCRVGAGGALSLRAHSAGHLAFAAFVPS